MWTYETDKIEESETPKKQGFNPKLVKDMWKGIVEMKTTPPKPEKQSSANQ